MILLFAGSTPIVRSALAEKICDENESWRHLAIEDLAEAARKSEDGKEYDEDTLIAIVCSCALKMQDEGYHMILSLSDVTRLSPLIRDGIGGDCLSVYLGKPEPEMAESFDHVIDTGSASIKDIHEFLKPLIDDPPEA